MSVTRKGREWRRLVTAAWFMAVATPVSAGEWSGFASLEYQGFI
jgi:hypothetical protein